MNKAELIATAKRWLKAGYSVIPVKKDKTPGISEWKPLQKRPYELDQLEKTFNAPGVTGIGVVTGFGGLMCFDFDTDKRGVALEPVDILEDWFIPWRDTVLGNNIEPALQDTVSGGIHAIVSVPTPIGNAKLARVPARPKPGGKPDHHTTIEVRGEGGYFVLHDLDLDPASIPTISDEQFQIALETAALMDKLPEPEHARGDAQAARGKGAKANATTTGNVGWFNERHTVREVLEANQYRKVLNKYLSPSSTSGNAGVVIFKDDNGHELCYSHHSDELGDGRAHDAFDTWKVLAHQGNFESAMGEVIRRRKDEENKSRFTFGNPKNDSPRARARGLSSEVTPNAENPVTDATTNWDHPMTPNGEMTPKDPDLGSNASESDPKSRNPAPDAITSVSNAPKNDLGSTPDTKGPARPAQQKPYLGSKTTDPQQLAAIQRWGDRPKPNPVAWLVHHLFQDNAENLLAGEPGVGKSWISGDLAVAIATGSSFLDRHTQQGPVLVINFDDPSEALSRSFAERAASGRGYSFAELDIFYWQPPGDRPYPPEGIITTDTFEFLLEQVSAIKPRCIIIDAYSSAFPSLDGNKAQDVIRAFESQRQLRLAADGDCSLILIDHTPKATMQDSKRRGVSGSQQKHAKTRTVHIIRHVDPGDVNGDDVLEWEVFKANAAPRQEPFGVDRNMDALLQTAKLTVRPLPERGGGAKFDRAAKAALTFLKSRAGEVIPRQELLTEIVAVANVSMETARRGLRSNEFLDHPQLRQIAMGGRGNPTGFSYEPDQVTDISLYDRLKELVETGVSGIESEHILREFFTKAEAGDDDAKDAIDAYLGREEVRDYITRNYQRHKEEPE